MFGEFFGTNDEHNDIRLIIFVKNLYLVHDRYVLMIVFEKYLFLYYSKEGDDKVWREINNLNEDIHRLNINNMEHI